MKTIETLLRLNEREIINKIEKSDNFVDDFSGCNFRLLFKVEDTEVHTFEHSGGIGLCIREEGERFKHCKAVV